MVIYFIGCFIVYILICAALLPVAIAWAIYNGIQLYKENKKKT